MTKFLMLIFAICTLFACNSKGWSKEERDKLINSCVSEAKARTPNITDAEVVKFCACYQDKIEKKYPKVKDMEKASPDEIFPLAEACVDTTAIR